ncbi:MAG: IS630 family transposase [Caldilineaceae bacterium]|nr:IS630 family transposase [Caldilineaceae bacterium]
MLQVVRRTPRCFGYAESRWRLARLAQQIPWLSGLSRAGVSQVLTRLGIHYKRGRHYVHSPDTRYWAKVDLIEQCRLRAYYAPERYVLLYLDELTFYRQPTLAAAYEAAGDQQPLAYRSHRCDTDSRILGALNALTGQVHYRQRSAITLPTLAAFWYDLCAAYPAAETIYVVLDNWPVHFHPAVLAPLQPQHLPWPPKLPPNWPTQPSDTARHDLLPIQLLCLPTYASWLNPIEKLWRWLYQDCLHLHRLADDWDALKARVNTFLDHFAHGSDPLLRYVGLLPI